MEWQDENQNAAPLDGDGLRSRLPRDEWPSRGTFTLVDGQDQPTGAITGEVGTSLSVCPRSLLCSSPLPCPSFFDPCPSPDLIGRSSSQATMAVSSPDDRFFLSKPTACLGNYVVTATLAGQLFS